MKISPSARPQHLVADIWIIARERTRSSAQSRGSGMQRDTMIRCVTYLHQLILRLTILEVIIIDSDDEKPVVPAKRQGARKPTHMAHATRTPSSSQPSSSSKAVTASMIVKAEHSGPSPLSADPISLMSSPAMAINDGETLEPVPSYVKYTTIWLQCAYSRLFMSRYPFTFVKSVVYLNRLQELLDKLHSDNTYYHRTISCM